MRWRTAAITAVMLVGALLSSPSTTHATGNIALSGGLLPYQGLRVATTLSAPGLGISNLVTANVADATKIADGSVVRIDSEDMYVVDAFADGPAGLQDTVTLYRTTPAIHNAGVPVLANFTSIKVTSPVIDPTPTGATLSAGLGSSSLSDSNAVVAEALDTSETWVDVSDAALLEGAANVQMKGIVGVTAVDGGFLDDGGREESCEVPILTPASLQFLCYTIGQSGSGVGGSGLLATVTLRGDAPGASNLTLSDAEISQVTCSPVPCNPAIPGLQLRNGGVVIGTTASPADPAACASGTFCVRVDLVPTTPVAVGQNFDVRVYVDNIPSGKTMGAYGFKLNWDFGTEDMTVVSVRRGHQADNGTPNNIGATLGGNINASTTTVPVNNGALFQPGWVALIDSEEMLVRSIAGNNLTVTRSHRGTTAASHSSGASIYAGQERIEVGRAAMPVVHKPGAPIASDDVVLSVNSTAGLSENSYVSIDLELFNLVKIPAYGRVINTGWTLQTQVSDTATTLAIAGGATVPVGLVVEVNGELMLVTASSAGSATVTRGYYGSVPQVHPAASGVNRFNTQTNTVRARRAANGTTAAGHSSGAALMYTGGIASYTIDATTTTPNSGATLSGGITAGATTIGVTNASLFKPGWFLIVDSEYMKVLGVNTGPNTLDVERGTMGSPAATHNAGAVMKAPVYTHTVAIVNGTLLGSTGRAVTCAPPVVTGELTSMTCNTSGALPLGPTASGPLAEVMLTDRRWGKSSPVMNTSIMVTFRGLQGQVIATSTQNSPSRVMRCPDVNGNSTVDFLGDLIPLARAIMTGTPAPDVRKHDINLDGATDFLNDVINGAKLIQLSAPAPLKCPPAPRGSLKVVTTVTNDNGGTATPASFNVHVMTLVGGVFIDEAGSPAAGSATGLTYSVIPALYVVLPDAKPGYSTAVTGDCDALARVTVIALESHTCTIVANDN